MNHPNSFTPLSQGVAITKTLGDIHYHTTDYPTVPKSAPGQREKATARQTEDLTEIGKWASAP